MQIRVRNRQTGKTYKIAQEMISDKDAIVVVPNQIMQRRFCGEYGIKKKRVITINELMGSPHSSLGINEKTRVYIDEIGLCMEKLIGAPLIYATHTGAPIYFR